MLSFLCASFSSFALVSRLALTDVSFSTTKELPPVIRISPLQPANSIFDSPLCYVRGSDGSVIDLTSLCGSLPTRPLLRYPSPPQVYDTGAIRSFDDAVYGKGN